MKSNQLYKHHVNLMAKEWDVRINDLKEKAENVGEKFQATELKPFDFIQGFKHIRFIFAQVYRSEAYQNIGIVINPIGHVLVGDMGG